VNLETLDPEVAASIPNVLTAPHEGPLPRVLSTSFGFGGLNAALVFGALD
jgi:3-oxoacyl-(acyl-carrier-protein) synthase